MPDPPRPSQRFLQSTLTPPSFTRRATPNLAPTGDDLITKQDNIIRIAYQNIRGTSGATGLLLPDEIDAMDTLEVDIMGMSETNCPWTPAQRSAYDHMMNLRFHSSRTIYTAAKSHDHSAKYQPGGNLLTINGRTTGRVITHGSDSLGRFCWYTLRGHRDEGILIVTAYRVCQEATDNPGPHTAFSQQYMALRDSGLSHPNPRLQILMDLTALISHHRSQGFRPIIMMDANGDYLGNDKNLRAFITNSCLCDPFYEKFRTSPPTHVNGSTRIDYILMDRALCPALTAIGYLGTHDGAISDHVVGYADFNERALFAGIINRPLPLHSREILIEQSDKVQDFLASLYPVLDAHNYDERVFTLAKSFACSGATDSTVAKYQTLYGQFLEIVKGISNKVGKKKYGYMRSPELGHHGRTLIAYKKILDCHIRQAPFTPALLRLLGTLTLDPDSYRSLSVHRLRVMIRQQRKKLWECQKRGEDLRQEWLADVARQRAQASGDPDWEKRLRRMIRRTRESALNRKLTAITKGRRGVLDRIQIPTHTWFFSASQHELYHYDTGVFVAYPASIGGLFHMHHTVKMPPSDIVLADISHTPNGWLLTKTSPLPDNLWKDITSQTEIESVLLARNQRHLEQVQRQGGQSTTAPITLLREGYGFNTLSSSILDGSPTDFDLTPEMSTFFSTLKQSPSERDLPPILGTITSEEVQIMFSRTRERTSSDPRTLNYSIWKCLAQSDRIARFLSVLFSLPFTYGFVNTHWSHMTDYMLEKKPGIRTIHTLRIIGKVAAEFNTCLKFFIGKKSRDNFENANPCEDQHGFRPHRSSVDAAMIKLLTFECARMQKSTVGCFQNDMTGHFDRMWPELTSIFATKFGVSKNIMLCIGKTIAALERNVETALGVSQACYSQATSSSRLGGMVQGKADVPQLSTQQMDIMLKTHKVLAPGLHLRSPSLLRSITRSSISYADDTDGQISLDTTDTTLISTAVETLRQNAQTWTTIADICGGLIALHKCNWHLIAWEAISGHLNMVQSTDETLVMQDCHGTLSNIQFLSPDQPNIGLGFHLCPDGSQNPHYQHMHDGVVQMCRSAAGAHLTASDMYLLLRQRIIPKLSYALHGSSFSDSQCSRINTLLRSAFLPGMRLNRHFPSAVLYGPLDYGGMEFPETSTLQDQVQLDYLLKQLRWDRNVANDFLVTLDSVQLCSGFSSPILEHVAPALLYLEPSYIVDLRRRLAERGASLWIESAWTPHLQREDDSSLMDQFSMIPGITRAKLRRANAVRIFLRVFSVADLADMQGTHIRDGMLQGDWQAGSDLLWPYQPKPPKAFWACFRWCIRQTICRGEHPNQPAHYSMRLDTPLGQWLPVPRNTWYTAYRSHTNLYWRRINDEHIYILTPSKTSGFYHHSGTTATLPLDSHPISFQQVGETIWTRSPFRPGCSPAQDSLPPGHMVENTLCSPTTEVITLGSDGSVHLSQQVAACAWVIHDSDAHYAKACFLLANLTSLSSYRSELEGIFRSLKHVEYLGLTPTEINQYCDNEAAVDKCRSPPWRPKAMIQADADILLAIHSIRHSLHTRGTTVTCRHIYAHQDTRTPRSPGIFKSDPHVRHTISLPESGLSQSTLPSDDTALTSDDDHTSHQTQHGRHISALPVVDRRIYDTPTRLNIECDKLASETTAAVIQDGPNHALPPTITYPLPGSKALLRIGDVWITSHTQQHILWSHRAHILRSYCRTKYGWDEAQFESIDWQVIKTVRKRCPHTKRTQTSKIMHDWLPVMHMLSHMTSNSQCPGCPCPDETLDHLFHCPHLAMATTRNKIIATFRKKGLKRHIPRVVIDAISTMMTDYFDQIHSPLPTFPSLRLTLLSQRAIGTNMFLRGFLVKGWTTALRDLGAEHPPRIVTWLLRFLWFECTELLWHERNNILHRTHNNYDHLASAQMDNRLCWFLDHRHLLSHGDQYLLKYSESDIDGMPAGTKRELLRLLEKAFQLYRREQLTRESGQPPITDYFSPITQGLNPLHN